MPIKDNESAHPGGWTLIGKPHLPLSDNDTRFLRKCRIGLHEGQQTASGTDGMILAGFPGLHGLYGNSHELRKDVLCHAGMK